MTLQRMKYPRDFVVLDTVNLFPRIYPEIDADLMQHGCVTEKSWLGEKEHRLSNWQQGLDHLGKPLPYTQILKATKPRVKPSLHPMFL